MPLRWSHAVMYVKDLDAMLDFYTGLLGFEVTDRGPIGQDGPDIVFMSQVETDHHQLAFLPVRRGDDPPNTVNHFAFRVDSLADVRELGAKVTADPRAGGVRYVTHGNAWSVYFSDPEGNGIEVFTDTPWHVRQPQARPWDPELGDADLHDWTKAEFEKEAGFGPIDAFYAARAERIRS